MNKKFNFKTRMKAATIHLSISALIAAMAATLVFFLWYPWPYRIVSGGQTLFFIVLSVDLVLGPMLTFVVFNHVKTRTHLVRDLVIVATLQLAGLVYGIYTVYLARPVALVFQVDRFRAITNVEVLEQELPQALPALRNLSLTGPRILGTRLSDSGDEQLKSIDMAVQGFDVATRPSYWIPYDGDVIARVLKQARPVSNLYAQYPERSSEIDAAIKKSQRISEDIKFLPLTGRETDWCVLLDARTAEIAGFVHLEGFF